MSEIDYRNESEDLSTPVSPSGRIVCRVTFDRASAAAGDPCWVIRCAGAPVGWRESKLRAVLLGRWWARLEWKQGRRSQLVVHGKNGRIQFEWTYGADPERSKG